MEINVIPANMRGLKAITIYPINYQYDIRQVLLISGIDLPVSYAVDFCNIGDASTVTMVGTADGVTIPDSLLQTGKDIKAFIVLGGPDSSVQTRYEITIPVNCRPSRTNITPTPAQQSTIDSLLEALNDGVERAVTASADAEAAAGLLENVTAEAETLQPGENATASYNNGVLSFGIPKGEPGAVTQNMFDTLNNEVSNVINMFVPNVQTWTPGTQHPTGWINGYWDDAGATKSSNNIIRTSYRYSVVSQYGLYDSIFAKIVFPSNYTMTVKVFDYEQSSILLKRYDFENGEGFFKIDNNTRIGFYLSGFNGNAATYANNQDFINQIVFYYYHKLPAGSFLGRTGEFEHFTVNINTAWPAVNDTTSGNAETIADTAVKCVLTLPETYELTGEPTPLIMFCHGSSCQITDSSWYGNNTNFLSMIRAFTAAGFAVFDVNNTRNDSGGYPDWGGLPLMSAYIKAWDYIKSNYNVYKKLFILSDSMGTCANLNMLKWHSANVLASIITAPRPVCKLRYETLDTSDPTEAAYKLKMAEAFGLSGTAWETDRLKGFSFYENLIDIDGEKTAFEKFPPLKVLVGADDTNFLTETREYFGALNSAGNYVNYREVSGANHSQVSFLSIGSLKQECINWFNRFR